MNASNKNLDPQKVERAMNAFLVHYSFVKSVAFHKAPCRSLQEDIVHDVFLYFVEKADNWELGDGCRALLKKITENIAHQYWDRWLKEQPEILERIYWHLHFPDESLPENEQFLEDRLSALDYCEKKLTPRSQILLELRYVKKHTIEKIAKLFNLQQDALYVTFSKIRRALRECIRRFERMEDDHDK